MFKSQRYSIEVYDDQVEFYGAMPLDELHQWLSHFQELGFDQVDQGSENSSLIISKSKGQEETPFRAEHERTLKELNKHEIKLKELQDLVESQKQYIIELNSDLTLTRKQNQLKEMEISRLNSHKILLTHILEDNHIQVQLEDECK